MLEKKIVLKGWNSWQKKVSGLSRFFNFTALEENKNSEEVYLKNKYLKNFSVKVMWWDQHQGIEQH